MSFGKLFGVVLLWWGCGVAAHAQLGLYGVYQGTSLTGIPCLAATGVCSNVSDTSPTTAGDNKVNPTGGFGGLFYDFRNLGPMRLGVDFRAGEMHSNKSAVTSAGGKNITSGQSYLVGARGSFHTPLFWLKPYVEVMAGFARNDAAVPPCETVNGGTLLCSGQVTSSGARAFDSYVQYEGLAGADIRLAPFLDLRAIELGIGQMNQLGNGNGASTSSIGMRSIGAGVVFHLP